MPVEAITFTPLSGASPETDGLGEASLPRLRSFGQQQPDTGVGLLPPLRSVGTGSATALFVGTGVGSLRGLRSLGFEAGANYGAGSLPALRALGGYNTLPVPQDGTGSAALGALSSAGLVSRGDLGVGSGSLPALAGFGTEAAGGYGVGLLPMMRSAGAEAAPSYEAFIISTLGGPVLSTVGTNDLILTAGTAHAATVALQYVIPITEAVTVRASAQSALRALEALQEGCSLAAVAAVVHQLVAVEAIVAAAVTDVHRRQIERAVDAVVVLGGVDSKLVAREAVVAAIAMDAMALRGWQFDAVASAAFHAEAAQTLRQVQALVESIDVADVAAMTARFTLLLDAAVVLADEASSKATFFELLRDGAAFHATLNLRGERYVAWVLNAETGTGVSRYEGFGFNSFACFNGRYFGAMDDGVHQLGGNTDNGAPIAAKVRSAMTNFGTSRMKRMAMVYLGLTNDGELVLKQIITSPKGVKEAFWYTLEGRPAQALREDRSKPDGGLESVYWQWELVNTDGANFDIDAMAFVPMAISRSV